MIDKLLYNLREKDQQDAHFFSIIYFIQFILDMFRKSDCSWPGVLYKQLTVFSHASL